MKKRLFTLVLSGLMAIGIMAQNIQVHYDLGSALYQELDDRPQLTTTIEFFRPDAWGSTYFFSDMDYAHGEVASAYWEIYRELKFWKAPIALHVEYNGGINHIKNAYLGGVSYAWDNKDFSKGCSVSALYKYLQDNPSPHSFQLTAVWHIHFAKGKFSFMGFADFWREEHTDIKGHPHDFVFLSEPQFWVNLNRFKHVNEHFKLSVGTEWEFSHDFAAMDGFYLNPTLALKWSF